jgi:hypothetical protein
MQNRAIPFARIGQEFAKAKFFYHWWIDKGAATPKVPLPRRQTDGFLIL